MNPLIRTLRLARESESLSKEQYSYESWALGTIRGMVSFWADEYTLNGEKMTGQTLVRWKKEVFRRIQELDEIFKEDEKLSKELREGKK